MRQTRCRDERALILSISSYRSADYPLKSSTEAPRIADRTGRFEGRTERTAGPHTGRRDSGGEPPERRGAAAQADGRHEAPAGAASTGGAVLGVQRPRAEATAGRRGRPANGTAGGVGGCGAGAAAVKAGRRSKQTRAWVNGCVRGNLADRAIGYSRADMSD